MNDQTNQAIGFLGGSFDPIHFGHLRPALEIRNALNLHKLFLMPNHIAPHKSKAHCSSDQRVKMLELALQSQPQINIDTRELLREQASYTIDSLIELKNQYPSTPICFIMGMDSLISFDKWYRWQEIMDYCHLVISHRPGWKLELNDTVQQLVDECKTTNISDLHEQQIGKIFFQNTTQLAISSSAIRKIAKQEGDIHYLLPDAVCSYIKANNLYRL